MSSSITVKPLVWTSSSPDGFGWVYYKASHQRQEQFLIVETPHHFVLESGGYDTRRYPTLEAAQAAAQKEWDAFILSALDIGESTT